MKKLVVNHLEKILVTSDCATIVKELEVSQIHTLMFPYGATHMKARLQFLPQLLPPNNIKLLWMSNHNNYLPLARGPKDI